MDKVEAMVNIDTASSFTQYVFKKIISCLFQQINYGKNPPTMLRIPNKEIKNMLKRLT